MEKITWKLVSGYDNYEISSQGTLRNTKSGKVLKANNVRGYLQFCLTKDKKEKRLYAHRLVSIAFIDNPENKPHVNHIDGDKANNHKGNLEWVTVSENIIHAHQTGLIDSKGENCNASKLKDSEVLQIRELLKGTGMSQKTIGNVFGVGQDTISLIKTGKRWSHLK